MYLVNIQDAISTTVIWIVDSRVYRDLPCLVYAKKTSLQGLKIFKHEHSLFYLVHCAFFLVSYFYIFSFQHQNSPDII